MAPVVFPLSQKTICLRCVRRFFSPNPILQRLFSGSTIYHEELQNQAPIAPPSQPPPSTLFAKDALQKSTEEVPKSIIPKYMQEWGFLDPQMVQSKKQERRLVRRDRVQPVGSRRRRAVLHRSRLQRILQVPFEQLPYQCFQEARKVLSEDRQEKLRDIATQQSRIKTLLEQDPTVGGTTKYKETRMRSMRNHLTNLIILADINDPLVKRKFEDGQGDMNKPIYRHLAETKWRQYKHALLQQRITQMHVVPDFLPKLDIVADIDIGFGRKVIDPGEFVDSAISETMPRLRVQTFTPGEKLVTVVVVDGDVPVPETDGFSYRCHFIASNIPISPTQTSIPLHRIAQDDKKIENIADKKISTPWLAPWAHKGSPYHRLAVFVLEQDAKKQLNNVRASKLDRSKFNLRSFVDIHKLKPITATLFRTQWDESMAGVMVRNGLKDQVDVLWKRKRVDPLPYKRRVERMR